MTAWSLAETFSFEDRYAKFATRGNGAPVVVHGTPWSSYNMRHLIEALSGDYSVYYFNLIGHGQSDKSNGDVSLRDLPSADSDASFLRL